MKHDLDFNNKSQEKWIKINKPKQCNKPFLSWLLPPFAKSSWNTSLHMRMSLICKTMHTRKYINLISRREIEQQDSF